MQKSAHGARRLQPEPWGSQIARAREDAGHTQRTAADALQGLIFCSDSTISRLEARAVVPSDARRRAAAAVLVVGVYGFDLADFNLSVDDIPEGIRVVVLAGPDDPDGDLYAAATKVKMNSAADMSRIFHLHAVPAHAAA